MLICEKYKFIYFDIPKTASSSFVKFFLDNIEEKEIGLHRHYFDTKEIDIRNYQCFAIVRNPYDRLVSSWASVKNNEMTDKFRSMSFFEFLESSLFMLYKTPQIDFLKKTNCLEDIKIIRFENLEEELLNLDFMHKFESISDFPHERKSNREEDHRIYLDKQTEEIIWNDYQGDFKEFGYERYKGGE